MRPHDLKYLRVKRWILAAAVAAVVAVVAASVAVVAAIAAVVVAAVAAAAADAIVAASNRVHLYTLDVAVCIILATSDTSMSAFTTVINVTHVITITHVFTHSIGSMISTIFTIKKANMHVLPFVVLFADHSVLLSAILVIRSTSTVTTATATATATATVTATATATFAVANVI